MATETLIPTTIQPEAADLAARLGVEAPLAEMVAHVKQTVPGLRKLTVEFAPAYDTGDDGILLHGYRDATLPSNHDCWEQFSAWKLARFSPDVWRHFNLILTSDNQHAG
jgi:hypothetical protein